MWVMTSPPGEGSGEGECLLAHVRRTLAEF